jgi:hypothetical protein
LTGNFVDGVKPGKMARMEDQRRRRCQFGLRALLLAFVPVAIVALPVGWYVRRPKPPVPVPVSPSTS